MSFEVKFGSQSNLSGRGAQMGVRNRGSHGHHNQSSGTDPTNRDQARGRGRSGRRRGGRGRRGRGGNRPAAEGEDDDDDDDDDGSGESDGSSSVTSEGQGRGGRRGGGRGRGQGDRGRGGKQIYNRGLDERGRGEKHEGRDSQEATSQSGDKPTEVHIHHYYSHSPADAPFSAPTTPGGAYPPSSGYHQPYHGHPPPSHPNYPSYTSQPPTSYPSQPGFSQGFPPQATYGEPFPARPTFSQAGQGPPIPPGSRPPLLSQPPPPLFPLASQTPYQQPPSDQRHDAGYKQQLQQQKQQRQQQQQHYGRQEMGKSAGSERGSRQNLNQRSAGSERGGGGEGQARQHDHQAKKGSRPKQQGGEQQDHQAKKGPRPKQQECEQQGADTGSGTQGKAHRKGPTKPENDEGAQPSSMPEVDPDEWIKVFNLLVKQFQGRTGLGTLMSRKGDVLKGLSHEDAATWLRHSNRFLTFDKKDVVKFVSVSFKEARSCFKYKKHNTDKCENDSCPFFHICRDFVAGCCQRGSGCHFSHSFHTKSNAKVCAEAGLQAFTDEEIRIIVFRSTPVVCLKFAKGGCQEDCPDIHICPKFLRGACEEEDCKFGHYVKGPEHNNWVLNVFHMGGIPEPTLRKMVLSPLTEPPFAGTQAISAPPDAAEKPRKPAPGLKKAQRQDKVFDTPDAPGSKARGMQRGRSQEALFQRSEMSLPTTFPVQETGSASDKKKRARRKPKGPQEKQEQNQEEECYSYASPVDLTVTVSEEGYQLPPREERSPGRGLQQSGRVLDDSGRDRYESGRGRDPGGFDQEQRVRSLSPQRPAQSPPPPPRRSQPQPRPRRLSPNRPAAKEGGDNQRAWPASHYTHLCEQFTHSGSCSRNYLCPRYHHRDRPPYLWQVHLFGEWQDFSNTDNFDIEKRFCHLASHEVFEAVLDCIGGAKLSVDFQAMAVRVVNNNSSDSVLAHDQQLKLRRWSTPSYVEAESDTPLHCYTQWCWFQMSDHGKMQPFIPGSLQYTLEEKYSRGQDKFYFEAGEERLLLLLKEMVLVNLSQGFSSNVMRRPIWSPQGMSPFLLSEPPPCLHLHLPPHWGSLDHYQDFEMVELDSAGTECLDVVRAFHATVTREAASILRVFRVQNPALWDKYCSTRRSMTPRDGSVQDVDERKLFHGTPTLEAARGICANNIDFRRSGEFGGSRYGRGAYFSTHALYSKNFTRGPDRYMFLARVLVGKYTRGKESYTSPPVREGLKLYDSCVDDETAPTIFVIFDLAQSYPEYLIQFEDATMDSLLGQPQSPGVPPPAVSGSPSVVSGSASVVFRSASSFNGSASDVPGSASAVSGTGSGLSRQDLPDSSRSGLAPGSAAPKPVPAPRAAARSPPGGVQYSALDAGLRYANPYKATATVGGGGGVGALPKTRVPPAGMSTSSSGKKSDNDKCLIS